MVNKKGGDMKRKTQKEKILALLKRKKFVSVPELMRLGIACYTKRISELREDGYIIKNHIEFDKKLKAWKSKYSFSFNSRKKRSDRKCLKNEAR